MIKQLLFLFWSIRWYSYKCILEGKYCTFRISSTTLSFTRDTFGICCLAVYASAPYGADADRTHVIQPLTTNRTL